MEALHLLWLHVLWLTNYGCTYCGSTYCGYTYYGYTYCGYTYYGHPHHVERQQLMHREGRAVAVGQQVDGRARVLSDVLPLLDVGDGLVLPPLHIGVAVAVQAVHAAAEQLGGDRQASSRLISARRGPPAVYGRILGPDGQRVSALALRRAWQ